MDAVGQLKGVAHPQGNYSYTYTPYGKSTANGTAGAANNLRYLGQYQTQRGELLFGYRNYRPDWGRFTQPDPTGQERNPYTYAGCDPANNADPSGAAFWSNLWNKVKCVARTATEKFAEGVLMGGIGGAFVSGLPGATIGAVGGGFGGFLWGTYEGIRKC